jgi:hypothetical protein
VLYLKGSEMFDVFVIKMFLFISYVLHEFNILPNRMYKVIVTVTLTSN